jgi:hypothetical protein
MPVTEYLEWQAYFEVEPWGSHYDDVRLGTIAAAIVNGNRDPSKSQPARPLDFAPWNAVAQRAQAASQPITYATPQEQARAIRELFEQAAHPITSSA